MRTAALLIALCLATPATDDARVRISVKPDRVLVEQRGPSQTLSFDLLVENLSGEQLELVSVRVSVLTARGRLVRRMTLDRHGLSPGIHTIPAREIAPGGTLYLFNPFHTFEGAVDVGSLAYELAFETPAGATHRASVVVRPVRYTPHARLVLPLEGRIVVEAGHDFYAPHRRIDLTSPIARQVGLRANSARYASDFTVADADGRLFRGAGGRLEDWFAFGAPVYAPAAGRVVTLEDGIPDNAFSDGGVVFSERLSPETPAGIFGNYVVVDHGNGEHSLLAHLQSGSFRIKKGERVARGQQIARIGFSGNTDFVHTHYQLQNGPDPAAAEGLPAYFHDFHRILGDRSVFVRRGPVDTGDVVRRR